MLLNAYSSLYLPQWYCIPYAAILQIYYLFSMIWYCQNQSPAVSKQQGVRWCCFRCSIPLSIDYVWHSCIDRAISTPSCSFCISISYLQIYRSILLHILLFAWFESVEFNRLPCSHNKMYDDVFFDDRFRYQLTMFEVCILIGLSRLLDTPISYEIAV